MKINSSISAIGLAVLMEFGVVLAAPTTQPAAVGPGTQPAGAQPPALPPATQPVATTRPLDARAAADELHKQLDPRWRKINEGQRNSQRTRWSAAPVAQTFKAGELIDLSVSNGMLKLTSTDFTTTATSARVAVEGSDAIYMLSRPRVFNAVVAGAPAMGGPAFSVTRFDFDAQEEQPWQTRLNATEHTLTFTAQSLYTTTMLSQNSAGISLRVLEFMEVGKPQKVVCTVQSATLTQLRGEHPEEFRMYVLPLLSRFADPAFLQPGAMDVYSVFAEITPDQRVVQELAQLLPQLDADDPDERDAASLRLRELGAPGVIAALRLDTTVLSEEQKLRVRAFLASHRRRPSSDPAIERHNLGFLIDCLEYDDPAIRVAAKRELENQTGRPIDFDPSLTSAAAARAADLLRARLLAPPPQPSTTQPSPAN